MKKRLTKDSLTYAHAGIDKAVREKSQIAIQSLLGASARSYRYGPPIELPFGRLFPTDKSSRSFYDFQIEGVGTKTLLAEIAGKYDTIGIDAVAMAVNDVIRSGSKPLLLSDAIHITRSQPEIVASILSGVATGAGLSGCTLASGETGDVKEILHEKITEKGVPFDLFASCLGIVKAEHIVRGKISHGDHIIGLESSGIHSNGISLARRVLLRKWGGMYHPEDRPDILNRTVIEELLEPTRIYSGATAKLKQKKIKSKATIHVTGDGLDKFARLLHFQGNHNLGIELRLRRIPAIFRLIIESSKKIGSPISAEEMFKTFNMGIGFAIVVSPDDSEKAIDSLNNEYGAEKLGSVSRNGRISIEGGFSDKKIFL
jgi:phosphoribosylformylglycinamidine cyclo-ligase